MTIYPAIDIMQGKCVRLYQGDYQQQTVYFDDPFAQAQQFVNQGATHLHVVDLDAAKDPQARQTEILAQICQNTSLIIQTGGGIRTLADVQRLFEVGVKRVVIGSLAVTNPELVCQWIQKFGNESIVIAMDVKLDENGEAWIATHGWQKLSTTRLFDQLAIYEKVFLRHLLCTDISRDGTMQGTNLELYQTIQQYYPALQLQASGGVASLNNILALRKIGVAGVIVGRALYENKFTLAEALTC